MLLVKLYILILAVCVAEVAAKCNTFQPRTFKNTSSYTYIADGASRIAGPIVNCSTAAGQTPPGSDPGFGLSGCQSDQCFVGTERYWNARFNRTINIDVSSANQNDIFKLAAQHFGTDLVRTDLNQSRIWEVGTAAYPCLNESTAGYWAFTPILRCVDGTLLDCSGSDSPATGTNVTVCGIDASRDKTHANGVYNILRASGVLSQSGPQNATGPRLISSAKSNMADASNLLFVSVFSALLAYGLLA